MDDNASLMRKYVFLKSIVLINISNMVNIELNVNLPAALSFTLCFNILDSLFENLELSFNYIIAYIFGRTMNWHNEIYKKIIKINDTFDKTDLRNYYNRRTKKIVEDLYEYDFNLYELGESKWGF